MTTRILIVNHGPQAVDVLVMHKGAEGPEPGMVAPDSCGFVWPVPAQSEWSEFVHSGQYLVVKEHHD